MLGAVGPAATIMHAISTGAMPGHADHQPAVVTPVRRPPVLRRGQYFFDVLFQRIEINLAEYFVRGLGYVKSIEDIEKAVIRSENNVPISVGDIARVSIGPATRRGCSINRVPKP